MIMIMAMIMSMIMMMVGHDSLGVQYKTIEPKTFKSKYTCPWLNQAHSQCLGISPSLVGGGGGRRGDQIVS